MIRIDESRKSLLLALLLAIVSFGAWFYRYQLPDNLFWDENYHVASAQKYLSGVFFMEPHPPLGKLLIAFGEFLLDRNPVDTEFLGVDHIKDVPREFSFAGYRFFPVLLAWLSVPLFFLLLHAISRDLAVSFVVALLYAFDNALIVHMRGAMLEGMQIFFIVCCLLVLALIHRRGRSSTVEFWGLAAAALLYSAAVATKVTALVVGLAFIPIFLPLLRNPRRLLKLSVMTVVVFLAFQCLVWQAHFYLGRQVMSGGNNRGFYRASAAYKLILAEGSQLNPLNFPVMLADSLGFFRHYEKGVPLLNLCKKGESGSPPYLWPVGARSISYRWDVVDGLISHTYLQINPVVWCFGLIGLVLAGVKVFHGFIFSRAEQPDCGTSTKDDWIVTLLGIWFVYMSVMVSVDRVMYLYHYFIPLVISLILLVLIIPLIRIPWRLDRLIWFKPLIGLLVIVATISSFYFYAPLTYGWPISDRQLASRALLGIWDLHCPSCPLTNHLARPWVDPKTHSIPPMRIGKVVSKDGSQQWGIPVQGATVEKSPLLVSGITYQDGIGVHARSEIRFPLARSYSTFSGLAGRPDYLKVRDRSHGSVIFEILVDGTIVWESKRLNVNDPPQTFNISVMQAETLELRVRDAGDGIENDHAVWLNLQLK